MELGPVAANVWSPAMLRSYPELNSHSQSVQNLRNHLNSDVWLEHPVSSSSVSVSSSSSSSHSRPDGVAASAGVELAASFRNCHYRLYSSFPAPWSTRTYIDLDRLVHTVYRTYDATTYLS